jgi:hypothetical protein
MNSYIKNKQRWAILNKYKEEIKTQCPDINEKSGIYVFLRETEDGNSAVYVGQAKNLLERTAQHLMGRKQHIDLSLYKRKWWDKQNPYGWKLYLFCNCEQEELDKMEKYYINNFLKHGYKLYNVTGGGQIDKAKDIGERNQTKLKSYKNGKNLGAEKVREKIKTYFEKYLDVSIKGKINKIKERKLEEFKKFIEM